MSYNFTQPYLTLGNGLNTIQGGGVGGWVELGRTTLGSANKDIDVSSLADKRYYMVLMYSPGQSTTVNSGIRLGNSTIDTGTNYASRRSKNGAADSTFTSSSIGISRLNEADALPKFGVQNIANLSGKEKLSILHQVQQSTALATTAPGRHEEVGKWVNTSNPLDILRWATSAATTWDIGSEVVVLGWDPADTHTNNFWEELASVNYSSGTGFDTGVFTPKKYLWIQCYIKATGALGQRMRCGSTTVDSSTNYSYRLSINGAADITGTSKDNIETNPANLASGESRFINLFVVNNASNEKLFIGSQTENNGAGATNAPERMEDAFKWVNTSNQIDIVSVYAAQTAYDTSSQIKVWGSD